MTDRQKAATKRGVRTLGAGLIALLLALITGPDGADLLGDNQALFVAIATPLLAAADKALRFTP